MANIVDIYTHSPATHSHFTASTEILAMDCLRKNVRLVKCDEFLHEHSKKRVHTFLNFKSYVLGIIIRTKSTQKSLHFAYI